MILVTGTSGALGRLVVHRLTDPAGPTVVAGTRSPSPGARRIDFDDPATLAAGFSGVDVLVFVSAGYAEDDVVLARHGAVIAPQRRPASGTSCTRAWSARATSSASPWPIAGPRPA